MYPQKFKDTFRETVGLKWRVARVIGSLGILASGPIYVLASHHTGFLMLVAGFLTLNVTSGREYFIESLRRIRTITELRNQLLTHGDNEFILKDILKDQVWRGETPDPEIERRLAEAEQFRIDFKAKLTEITDSLISKLNAHLDNEKKEEPN